MDRPHIGQRLALARLTRRIEKLEERFNDVLAAIAEKWTSLSGEARDRAGMIAEAAAGRTPKKRNGNGGDAKAR